MRVSNYNGGRPWRFTFTLWMLLMLCYNSSASAQSTRLTLVVNQPLDDMEEYVASGGVDWNSSDLELVNEGGGDQLIGLRFGNVTIPQGAVITGAWLQLTADETNTGATTLAIWGQAVDNAASFENASYTVSTRPKTTAKINWVVNPWSILQEKGTDQKSPDIKSVIQEIVNRENWYSGNGLGLIITGSGKRVAESYEGATSGAAGHDANQAANLIIDYIVPTTVSSRVNASADDAEELVSSGAMDLTSSDLELTEDAAAQLVGMRWPSLNVPKGAIVSEAYVQFAADELHNTPTALTIKGFANNNTTAFTTAASDISARATTIASVDWSPSEWAILQEASGKQRTPNIASIIQEVIDRAGWSTNSAIGIRITGTGKRVAESFDGSPTEAPLLIVKYYLPEAPVVPPGSFPVLTSATWRYLDNGSDQGTAWRATDFDDHLWKAGVGQLGYGDGDETTVVGYGPDANNKYVTTYFRHTFNVNSLSTFDSLIFSLMRDDGAVIYLNGTEIIRSNMPAGTITYTTGAASNVGGAAESQYFTYTVPKNLVVLGKNVIAVEVHQDVATSSDLSFSMSVTGKKNDAKLLSALSDWKYLDNGFAAAGDWNKASYSDAAWKSGTARFGYGNAIEATTVNYGPNAAYKYITTYFRKTFTVSDTTGFGSLQLKLKRDDGAVVYLNGIEAFRSNMPGGPISYTTPASSYVEGAEEDQWQTIYIDRTLLKPGQNLIAVEVHQNSPTSTDLLFDAELTLLGQTNALTASGGVVVCDQNGSDKIGCFTSIVPAQSQIANYPSQTHTFQRIVKSLQDKYTGMNTVMPNGNDFTGYIPKIINGQKSSMLGYLSINHENTPGGVSMLSIHLDPKTMLWKVDTIRKVDYTGVVQSTRNCSGGVTPWGTVISSEESYNPGDANSDGYTDVGWQVEIDPVTAKIRDFNNDGKPDKLWAVGRMSHENITLSNDSMTIYQGEDGGSGCIYKFVATQKMRLDQGTLYALKRDVNDPTKGTWIQIPNTTQTERNTTSTLAGNLGCYKFGGIEDAEIGPDGMVYFSEKNLGDIWRFQDNGTTVSNLEKYVSNISLPLMTSGGLVNEPWNTGVDNLAFDGEGNLWALQDGGRDFIWVVRPGHTNANPKIDLFGSVPAGAEPTGITFSPDYKYLFISFQNPNSTNTATQKDAADSNIVWNASTTMVFARKEYLGANAVSPVVELGNDIRTCDGAMVKLRYFNRDAQNIWSFRSAKGGYQAIAGTDSTFNVTQTGMVYLTAIGNNGKQTTDSVYVTLEPLPAIDLGPDRVLCSGSSITLDAGAWYSSYKWEDGSTNHIRTITKPGKYYVMASTLMGCSSTDTINVTEEAGAIAHLGNDVVLCQGSTATLNPGAGFTAYNWNTGATTPVIGVDKAGEYWVRTVNNKGCISFDTVVVRYSQRPNLGSDLTMCEGSNVVLNPGSIYSRYEWSDKSTGQTVTVNKSGQYWVRVRDENGCTQMDTVNVTFEPLPIVRLGRDTIITEGTSIVLDGGIGSTYKWNTGAETRTITVNQTGTYSVTVTNQSGCSSKDEIEVLVVPVSGVQNFSSNEDYEVAFYPNPFQHSTNIQFTLKKQATISMEVYDLAGRKIADLAEGDYRPGKQEFKFDAEKWNANNAFYILKLRINDKEYVHKLIRK